MLDLIFTIEPKPQCGFQITSQRPEGKEEYIYITKVIYNAVKETDVKTTYYKQNSLEDINVIHQGDDGWYSIQQILIPKRPEGEGESIPPFFWDFNQYGIITLYDSQDKQTNAETVFEFVERHLNSDYFVHSPVQEFFQICKLWECYLQYSLALLSNCLGKCESEDPQLRFKRDMVWMALNVLNYYKDMQIRFGEDHFAQMQLILENFINCYGMCSNISIKNTNSCGCHRV